MSFSNVMLDFLSNIINKVTAEIAKTDELKEVQSEN